MKRTHIALFLALSAGYLGAASAENLPNKARQTDKEVMESSSDKDSLDK
ncbi:hypothetical protein HNR62_001001 [Oceanisphaera litoralis]|nr:hypothetical protein [Oceanisphaera litoralis]MBM7455141.1 hypothetical protein [Oceanisphaera litoralis]